MQVLYFVKLQTGDLQQQLLSQFNISSLRNISGIDVDVYIKNSMGMYVLLDGVSTVNIFVQREAHEIHDITSFVRKFVQLTAGHVTGLIQFNQQQLQLFDHLDLQKIMTSDYTMATSPQQFVYYTSELMFVVKRLLLNVSQNVSASKFAISKIVLRDVYFSQPGLTLIPDQQAVQLVQQFTALSREAQI